MGEDLLDVLLVQKFRLNQGLDEIHRFLGRFGQLDRIVKDFLGNGHDRRHCGLVGCELWIAVESFPGSGMLFVSSLGDLSLQIQILARLSLGGSKFEFWGERISKE